MITGYTIWEVAEWLEAHWDGEPYEIFRNIEPNSPGYRMTVERIGDWTKLSGGLDD